MITKVPLEFIQLNYQSKIVLIETSSNTLFSQVPLL